MTAMHKAIKALSAPQIADRFLSITNDIETHSGHPCDRNETMTEAMAELAGIPESAVVPDIDNDPDGERFCELWGAAMAIALKRGFAIDAESKPAIAKPKARPVAATVYLALYDSAHSVFSAVGATRADAHRALVNGLNLYGKQHKYNREWYYIDEISIKKMAVGAAYCDYLYIKGDPQ
jgi:hypothetical protein